MEKQVIKVQGGRALKGAVKVEGAKNSALKLMAATILCPGRHAIQNIPDIADTQVMVQVLRHLGAVVDFRDGAAMIDTAMVRGYEAPYELVSQMRASTAVLGPLVARVGRAKVAMPGGCQIGSRKLDMHIKGLEALGASFELEHGYMDATAPEGGLHAAHIKLSKPSVGATENILMAATLADGISLIENVAREPEIMVLVRFLQTMGAEVEVIEPNLRAGKPAALRVTGGARLHPVQDYPVIGDRIEACTFVVAGALCGGPVTVTGIDPDYLQVPLDRLRDMGIHIATGPDSITVAASGERSSLTPIDITTLPYPGLATDVQAFFMTLMSLVPGVSHIKETIFENRFTLAYELNRMGAHIAVDGNLATIAGVEVLSGAPVESPDLRGGAALVLAGLAAEGETTITKIHHIDRGYQDFCGKLKALGARVKRTAL
jgi:UDP-N-acetylglucosamine 1-carboxyvinyltransferase